MHCRGKGTLRQHFLASPLPWLPTFNLRIREARAGEKGKGEGLQERALPSPLKVQAPPPLSWLQERPGGSKNDRE